MKNLGDLYLFLHIQITSTPNGLFLNQSKYAHDLLHEAPFIDCKPTSTLVALRNGSSISSPSHDPYLYRSIEGSLQYLTIICLVWSPPYHDPRLYRSIVGSSQYLYNSVCQVLHHLTEMILWLSNQMHSLLYQNYNQWWSSVKCWLSRYQQRSLIYNMFLSIFKSYSYFSGLKRSELLFPKALPRQNVRL